jgi:hypothetical protein
VGDTKAGSKAARPGVGYRRRAVGTRDKIISHLALVEDVEDDTGMASTRLAEAVDYPGSSVAFAQLLSGMERDGLIAREVRGKRTYRITLTEQGEQRRLAGATAAGAAHRTRGGRTGAARAGSGAPAGRAGSGTSAAARGRSAAAGSAAGRGAGRSDAMPGRSGYAGAGRRTGAVPVGALADSGDEDIAEFDYDELARRLLIQVVRRLAAGPGDRGPAPAAADPFSLEETVAGLERELATAWTRHGTLTAENMKLRQQLREAQRDLDAERRARRRPVSDDLDRAEAVLLDRLLSPADEPGASAG